MIFKIIIFRLTKFSQLRASWNQAALWTGISRELLTVRKKETFFLINLQTLVTGNVKPIVGSTVNFMKNEGVEKISLLGFAWSDSFLT